jgi:hypothetical protein
MTDGEVKETRVTRIDAVTADHANQQIVVLHSPSWLLSRMRNPRKIREISSYRLDPRDPDLPVGASAQAIDSGVSST